MCLISNIRLYPSRNLFLLLRMFSSWTGPQSTLFSQMETCYSSWTPRFPPPGAQFTPSYCQLCLLPSPLAIRPLLHHHWSLTGPHAPLTCLTSFQVILPWATSIFFPRHQPGRTTSLLQGPQSCPPLPRHDKLFFKLYKTLATSPISSIFAHLTLGSNFAHMDIFPPYASYLTNSFCFVHVLIIPGISWKPGSCLAKSYMATLRTKTCFSPPCFLMVHFWVRPLPVHLYLESVSLILSPLSVPLHSLFCCCWVLFLHILSCLVLPVLNRWFMHVCWGKGINQWHNQPSHYWKVPTRKNNNLL